MLNTYIYVHTKIYMYTKIIIEFFKIVFVREVLHPNTNGVSTPFACVSVKYKMNELW